ncbi:regulatory protein, luxR family [Lentzea jiangxiensis]|uniref:Regulatory protein, luxR family n=1 Tax=Lentzea jiangxiensis TaxID=641025 RepID=A0A1H0W718_9PSEU|nr:regulatory protein, luxR family [Lentzea jiangxiensis]
MRRPRPCGRRSTWPGSSAPTRWRNSRVGEVHDEDEQGPTSRQIAETPHLTRRMVELHLSSVYRELGIHGRAELVTALWS